MFSIIAAIIIAGQRDYMELRRFTGIVTKVEFNPYWTMTVVVPDIKKPLVLTARGIALFEDEGLKKKAYARIKKEIIGKEFMVMTKVAGSNSLSAAFPYDKEGIDYPGAIFVDGLLYAQEDSPLVNGHRIMANQLKRGIYALPAKTQAAIVSRTTALLKKAQLKKH